MGHARATRYNAPIVGCTIASGGSVANRGPGSPADMCSTWNHAMAHADMKLAAACVPPTPGASRGSVPQSETPAPASRTTPVERQTSSPLSPRGGPDHIDAGHRGRDSERCKLAVTLAGRPSTSMRGSSPTGWTTPMPLVETVSRETWTAVGRRCSLWVATRHDPRSEPLRCCQHQTRRDSCGQLANNPQASNR